MIRDPFNSERLAPTGLTAFANQDYAGAFASAVVQEGFGIVGKVEQDDAFGMAAWLANQEYLAASDFVHRSGEPRSWPARPVDVVFGNPPCSGFSILTRSTKWQEAGLHGSEARQNHCMYDLIDHAVRCMAKVVVFESVQSAGTTGFGLMCELQNRLEQNTGKTWHITLVLMNAMSVGGWPDRRRFFFVASRLGPVDMPAASGISRPLKECIGDLIDRVEDDDPTSPYSTVKTPKSMRHRQLAAFDWPQGTPCSAAYEKAVQKGYTGPAPDRSDLILNPFTSARWKWDSPARVCTGSIMDTAVHPLRPRTFTHAEVGRIMGFPPEYDLRGITRLKSQGRALYGKGIPSQSGRWVMEGVRRHLTNVSLKDDIKPEPADGTGQRWTIDVTESWRLNKPLAGEQLALEL